MASCDIKGLTIVAEVAACSSTVLGLSNTLSLGLSDVLYMFNGNVAALNMVV